LSAAAAAAAAAPKRKLFIHNETFFSSVRIGLNYRGVFILYSNKNKNKNKNISTPAFF
jgi:hypothetical protein